MNLGIRHIRTLNSRAEVPYWRTLMAPSADSEITALREEVSRLSKIISAQSARAYSDTRDRANEAYEAALPHARRALEQVKAEGSAVAEATREHPVGIGGVVILATALGMVVGYALGAATQSEPRSWWRDYF